jgi:hypothetical protein
MSSRENHINITRDNYEEYFLLYIDNELPAAAKKEIDTFLLLHPDLQEEFELLQGTKLEADSFVFNDKEALLAGSFRKDATDESLLLFLDNELDENESKRVQFELDNNLVYYNSYQQLKAARLDPDEKIICPFKTELYHTDVNRRPVYWLRIAAAAILLIGAGSLVLLNKDRANDQPVASQPAKKPLDVTSPVKQTETTPAEQVLANADDVITQPEESTPEKKIEKTPVREYKVRNIVPDDQVAAVTPEEINHARTVAIERDPVYVAGNDGKINPHDVVTNPVVTSYNSIAGTSKETQTVADVSNGKQGSVRGLLRKATRFIEHRTGINAVNDDDKLLVGMVAINLK